MQILAVDDEALARKSLTLAITEVFPDANIYDFGKASDCMDCLNDLVAKELFPEYAFLDIQLRGSTGIELAQQIRKVSPFTTIIFVTAFNDYASEAFSVQAKGYILKPVDADAIRGVIDSITPAIDQIRMGWKPDEEHSKDRLCVTTFGKFSPRLNGKELPFERSKCKELLALLIDKRGAGLTNGEIEAYLWEDATADNSKRGYVQKVIYTLMKTLKEAGIDDIIDKRYNYLAIKPDMIECDYYAFLEGDTTAINSYYGIYMEEYSWAETTTGLLNQWK